jgi:hypothetical protein
MKTRLVVKNLSLNKQWLEDRIGKKSVAPDELVAENIMIGCAMLIRVCCGDFSGWLHRRRDRKPQLAKIRKSYCSKKGSKVLKDLLDYAIGCVETATWIDNHDVGPIPVLFEPRTMSDDHKAAIAQGRRRGQQRRKDQIAKRMAAAV